MRYNSKGFVRHSSEASCQYLFDWYKGNKYHIADMRGRHYLCDCARELVLPVKFGYRRRMHEHIRNDPDYLKRKLRTIPNQLSLNNIQ